MEWVISTERKDRMPKSNVFCIVLTIAHTQNINETKIENELNRRRTCACPQSACDNRDIPTVAPPPARLKIKGKGASRVAYRKHRHKRVNGLKILLTTIPT